MKETISIKLFRALQKGKDSLGKEALQRISCFIVSQRTAEEAFVDKSGHPDLYYTAFGWMLSYVLGLPIDQVKAEKYLARQNADTLDLIHYAAYIRCRMILRVLGRGKTVWFIESLFASRIRALQDITGLPHDDPQSPYTLFIWLSLLEDTGHLVKEKKSILASLTAYRAPGGGYMNISNGLTATTNATAAALTVTGQLQGYQPGDDALFLKGLQQDSGGFSAAKASPIPDLLSTATALFTLGCYGIRPVYPAGDFIESHWLDSGGFSATLLDDKSDVEYTFYGLLALGST